MKSDSDSETEKKLQRTCDIENFKMVVEHFDQDLREFWNRANFYLVANAGLFSAFLIIYPALIRDHLWLAVLVSFLGIAVATFWFLVLRGALYWIERWRQEVMRLSKELDRFQCFYNVEGSMKDSRSKSPSVLTRFLPVVFMISWIAILVIVLLGIF